MNEGFEFTLHALKSPAFGRFFAGFHPVCGRLLAPWVAGRRLVGWVGLEAGVCSGVRGGGAKQRGRNRGDVNMQQQKQKEGGERENQSGGVSRLREGEGEIRGRKITVLPFPYLYRFRDSPNLNAARLIRKPIPKPKSIIWSFINYSFPNLSRFDLITSNYF